MLANLDALGWAFMLLSCGSVTWLTFWCFKKVLTDGDEPDLPGGLGP
ncbi:MAG: hypothetical protein WAT39_16610 [Planctomycetota bacterium]